MFDKLVADLDALYSDFESSNWGQLWTDFGAAVVDAAPIVGPFLSGKKSATPVPEADRLKLKASCDKLGASLEKADKKRSADGGILPGDGSVLKAVIALIAQLLLMFGPIHNPTPAPAGS